MSIQSLIKAIQEKNIQKVQNFLKEGLDLNVWAIAEELNPLFHAIDSGEVEICKLLLENGADANSTDKDRDPVLFKAASSGNIAILDLLLDKGADISILGYNQNDTIYHIANSIEVLDWALAKGMGPFAVNDWGDTALSEAMKDGNTEKVKWYIEKGYSINHYICYINLFLSRAARAEGIEILELFIKKGLDVNDTDCCGQSLLHLTASPGMLDYLKLLIARGGDETKVDYNGRSVLALLHFWPTLLSEINTVVTDVARLYNFLETGDMNGFFMDPLSSLEVRWEMYKKYYKTLGQNITSLECFESFLTQNIVTNVYNKQAVHDILTMGPVILNKEINYAKVELAYPKESFLSCVYEALFLVVDLENCNLVREKTVTTVIKDNKEEVDVVFTIKCAENSDARPSLKQVCNNKDLQRFVMEFLPNEALYNILTSAHYAIDEFKNGITSSFEESKEDHGVAVIGNAGIL